MSNPDDENLQGPLTWTRLENTRWAMHSWIDEDGLMYVVRDHQGPYSLACYPSNRCDWLWLGKKEMAKPSLGPELKLTTPEGQEFWLDEPDYFTSHTEVDETGHLAIDPDKAPVELDRAAFGRSDQVGTLQKCTWAAFSTKNTLGRSRGPEIKVTSPEDKESWLEDLAYYPQANSWADLDGEEE
ncbi:hypothetical protein B0T25DRAFT_356311 [Lasiosphaeria hispida]|uniref:Uncharacterized protein n=1 Tax=Lasiosphaeria hispida TaxID=260671 RepID=A0AAJ0H805_9PEZI|nr:hypothetical protein B0T25DRAFT_356311 [Lasiosphaeria hispida]